MLKSYRVGWGGVVVVAYEILVSAQGPLVLGFWVLGLRVWGQGLTINALKDTYQNGFSPPSPLLSNKDISIETFLKILTPAPPPW